MSTMIECISTIDGLVHAERMARMRIDVAKTRAMNTGIVPKLAWQMGRPIRYGGEFGGSEGPASHVADQIEIGTVFMNRADHLYPDLCWTGRKDKGSRRRLVCDWLSHPNTTKILPPEKGLT